MQYVLVSPRLAVQKKDFLGSGVPYWPIELATLAAFLRDRGNSVSVLDLFGMSPDTLEDRGDFYLQGMSLNTALNDGAIQGLVTYVLYAISYMSHQELLDIIAQLKETQPSSRILVLENSQAVTAYAISSLSESFLSAGAYALICGEPYWNWDEIETTIKSSDAPIPENVLTSRSPAASSPKRKISKKPTYPVPAWDLFPIQQYWKLPYSHGPKTKAFLPILTSRGCPYACNFCIVPETNETKWRARSPEEIVNEILVLKRLFGVTDFQVEDLNPTVNSVRWSQFCKLLVERDAAIHYYIVSGTKAETVKLEDIPLYAQSGCRYISISPESGSAEVMSAIGKPFDYDHGIRVVETCAKYGIRTQACFVVGHPAEKEKDFKESEKYLKNLIKHGLDEAAFFVISPFAGSALFKANAIGLQPSSMLTSFSPKGRKDWQVVSDRRQKLIRTFFIEKLKRGLTLWVQGIRAIFGTPQTKMENLPRRVLYIYLIVFKHIARRNFYLNRS